MPLFRDIQGNLYDIPKDALDKFRIQEPPKDTKIGGGEIGPGVPAGPGGPGFPGGYFWDPRPGGYYWDPRPGGYHWGPGGYRWTP